MSLPNNGRVYFRQKKDVTRVSIGYTPAQLLLEELDNTVILGKDIPLKAEENSVQEKWTSEKYVLN